MTQSLSVAASTKLPVRGPAWRRWYLAGLTALTAYSTGIGWQAQLVSYPFFGTVPAEHFATYHQQYNQAIPVVVILPGFLSFLAGIAFLWTRPRDVRRPAAVVVATGGLVSLLATVLWAIPMHDRLDQIGQSAATLDSLLQANLVRSLALTVGTVVLVRYAARSGRR